MTATAGRVNRPRSVEWRALTRPERLAYSRPAAASLAMIDPPEVIHRSGRPAPRRRRTGIATAARRERRMSNGDNATDPLLNAVARLEQIAARAEASRARRDGLEAEVQTLKAQAAEFEQVWNDLEQKAKANEASAHEAAQRAAQLEAEIARLKAENQALLAAQTEAANKIDRAMAQIEALIAA